MVSVHLSYVHFHLHVLWSYQIHYAHALLSHSPFPVLVSGVSPAVGHPNIIILSSSLLAKSYHFNIFQTKIFSLACVSMASVYILILFLSRDAFHIFFQSLHTAVTRISFLNHGADLVTSLLASLWWFLT